MTDKQDMKELVLEVSRNFLALLADAIYMYL